MAQRRYTQEQINRAISAGERPADTSSWYTTQFKDYIPEAIQPALSNLEWWHRNVYAGVPNAVTGMAGIPDVVKSAGSAAYDWAVNDKPFGQAFATARAGGEENMKEIQDYINREVNSYLDELPPEQRNDPEIQKRIVAHVQGSQALHDFQLARQGETTTGSWAVSGERGSDAVRRYMGLQPTYQMTSGDELGEIVGGAMIPTNWVTAGAKVMSKAPAVARAAYRLGEWLVPGSHGVGNAVANIAAPAAVSQTLRAVSDAPSVVTGDVSAANELPAAPSGQATSSNTPKAAPAPTPEAANAQSPFSIISAASAAEGPEWVAPFQYGAQKLKPIATPTNVDTNDPEQGGGGSSIAKWLVGGGAAVALVAAAMRGKLSPPVAKQVIDDIDSPSAALRMQPTARDVDGVSGFTEAPTSTRRFPGARERGRRISVGITKDKATKYVAGRARVNDPNVEQQIADLTRLNVDASPMEVSNAHSRTVKFGEMPLLGRNTIPLDIMRQRAAQELDATQLEQLRAAAINADRIGNYDFQVQDLQKQMADLRNQLLTAQGTNRRNALYRKHAALQTEFLNRSAAGAKLDDGTSVAQARAMVNAAQADPRINKYLQGLRKIVADADENMTREGLMTRQHLQDRRASNPAFLPSKIDPYGKLTSMEKIRARFLDRLKGRAEPGEGTVYGTEMYGGRRGPTTSYKQERKTSVNEMMDPFDAVDEYIYNMHRSIRHNRSAKRFVDMVMGTDDWGRTVKKVAEPISVQDYENHRIPLKTQNALKDDHVFLVNDNGMIHFFRAFDREVARGLRHNPSATMSVMDGFRRMLQMTYTSSALAPWFAWRAMRNELGVLRTMQPAGYSAGYIQKALKNGVANTGAWDKIATALPDPTFNLRMLNAVGSQMGARAIKRWADFLGQQLALNSTMVQMFGEARIRAAAQAAVRAYNDTTLAVLTRRGVIDNMKTMERQASIFKDIDAAQTVIRGLNLGGVGGAVKNVLGLYIDLADSIRNAPRIGFFSENLEGLLQKYKGNVPQDEIRKLTRVTQHLTGDITRAIGNKGLATGLSISPYGVNSANSLLHILEGYRKNKTYIASRVMTNMILPKVAWTLLLSGVIGSQFDQEWWDNIPLWQRQANVPMLSPAYMVEYAKSGGQRKPTMDDVIFMPQEPEGIVFSEVAMTLLQSLGFFGTHAADTATYKDALKAIGTMMNVNIPFVDMYNALTGNSESAKYERETLTGPNETSRRFIDMIHSVVGGSFDLIGNAAIAGNDAVYQGGDIADWFENAFGYGVEGLKQKLQETPLAPIWGGQRRHYTKTQVRERNQSKFEKIRAVDNMLTTMRKAGGEGQLQPRVINDPVAARIAATMHAYANSGPMKVLRKRRIALYNQIDVLDENKSKVPPAEYTRRTEMLKHYITAVDQQEEEMFNRLDTVLEQVGGIEGGLAYIKQHITP